MVTRDFQPALGYNTDQNSVGDEFDYGVQTRYEKGRIEARGWGVNTGYFPYLHVGGVLHAYLSPYCSWRWRRGRSLSVGITRARQYDQDSSDLHVSYGWNTRDMYRMGYLFALDGTRAGGDYHYLAIGQGFHPKRNLSVNPGEEYSHLAPPSPGTYHAYQTVLTASYDLTAERCISARFVARDGGVNVFATYR